MDVEDLERSNFTSSSLNFGKFLSLFVFTAPLMIEGNTEKKIIGFNPGLNFLLLGAAN